MYKEHVSIEKIGAYIEERLDLSEQKKVKEHLVKCADCFHIYVQLKDAMFLQSLGDPITPSTEKWLNEVIQKEKEANPKTISLIIRFLKDSVSISEGDQGSLAFTGIKMAYSFRNTEPGPVAVSRKVGNREITLILSPLEDQSKVALSVQLSKREKLTASLYLDQEEIESISIQKQGMFETLLPIEGKAMIVFQKKGKKEFCIQLDLKVEEPKKPK